VTGRQHDGHESTNVRAVNQSAISSVRINMNILSLRTAATLLACAACVSSPQTPKPKDAAPQMMAVPRSFLDRCTGMADLEVACPTKMPFIDGESRANAFGTGHSSVFFAEWSGPYPGLSGRNAPPRFAHINVIASPVDHPLAFDWPTRATAFKALENVPRKRSAPLLVGAYMWAGRKGEVALAPPFPAGGIEGDHLIFRWVEADTAYSISLHAWKPVAESFNSLRAVVRSVPLQS
jgi:hypothetical protein